MGLFKRSMAVTSINFNCWRQDFRVKFILLFTALIVFNTLKPVLQYGLDNGAVSTPLLLPLKKKKKIKTISAVNKRINFTLKSCLQQLKLMEVTAIERLNKPMFFPPF